jgi:putative endonuclease
MPAYLYILLCSDNTYFTGLTTNPERRLKQHQLGYFRNCYTYRRRPVKLCYEVYFEDFEDAARRHNQIKKWSQAKKEALIYGNHAALPPLAKKIF